VLEGVVFITIIIHSFYFGYAISAQTIKKPLESHPRDAAQKLRLQGKR
jgi:uncharacterized protein YneF (UPF0154 family)